MMKTSILLGQKKGQFSLEYLIAFLLFATVIVYLSFQMSNGLPQMHMQSERNKKLSQAYGITDDLIKTRGSPEDWETQVGNIEKFGLATEPNLLNENKLNQFEDNCTNHYETTKERLGLSPRRDFQIRVDVNDASFACGKERIPEEALTEEVVRYVTKGEEVGRMVFTLW